MGGAITSQSTLPNHPFGPGLELSTSLSTGNRSAVQPCVSRSHYLLETLLYSVSFPWKPYSSLIILTIDVGFLSIAEIAVTCERFTSAECNN
jgi:hypothetical protein